MVLFYYNEVATAGIKLSGILTSSLHKYRGGETSGHSYAQLNEFFCSLLSG